MRQIQERSVVEEEAIRRFELQALKQQVDVDRYGPERAEREAIRAFEMEARRAEEYMRPWRYRNAGLEMQSYDGFVGAHKFAPRQPSATAGFINEWEAKLRASDAQLEQTKKELEEAKKAAGQNAEKAAEAERLSERYREENEQKRRHIDLMHLLTRVNPHAAERLLRDQAFQTEFLKSPCAAYVLSIDVRRSTELMLKARDPAGFAQFLIELARHLKNAVLVNNGVFEKFTGDGILAYFPEHFTGKDAGYFALKAAAECHVAFDVLYRANRNRFNSIIKNTGLGIGIDYGTVHTMVVSGEFAVVGTPVVYACRMAGANAGDTLLNQGAFELIMGSYDAFCMIEETEIEIKHEGPTVAYRVKLKSKQFQPQPPPWVSTAANIPIPDGQEASPAPPLSVPNSGVIEDK